MTQMTRMTQMSWMTRMTRRQPPAGGSQRTRTGPMLPPGLTRIAVPLTTPGRLGLVGWVFRVKEWESPVRPSQTAYGRRRLGEPTRSESGPRRRRHGILRPGRGPGRGPREPRRGPVLRMPYFGDYRRLPEIIGDYRRLSAHYRWLSELRHPWSTDDSTRHFWPGHCPGRVPVPVSDGAPEMSEIIGDYRRLWD